MYGCVPWKLLESLPQTEKALFTKRVRGSLLIGRGSTGLSKFSLDVVLSKTINNGSAFTLKRQRTMAKSELEEVRGILKWLAIQRDQLLTRYG